MAQSENNHANDQPGHDDTTDNQAHGAGQDVGAHLIQHDIVSVPIADV